MATRDLVHPRDAILRAIERIYRYRMTTTSGGNLSIRDDDGSTWITPARVDKGGLRREDIVHILPDGNADGPHPPSSEWPFHRAIYEARPDLRGIVHAHPVALVAFSVAGRVPETRALAQARRICGTVGYAPYALPGSIALGRNIAVAFADGPDCVVLENHGVVTAGPTIQRAFERFETLEFAAKTIIKASHLGEVRYLDEATIERKFAQSPDAPSFDPDQPSSVEKELRRQLCEFVGRAYRQRLMISTEGAFSARLDAETFLVTPHGRDRAELEPADLVLVRGGRVESGKVPSTSHRDHRAIYEAEADVRSIINAYPVNATAFSLTDVPLDARTIPESYLLLRDVGRDPSSSVTLRRPARLLPNDGVQVCGTSVLDAFDRLEVLESTAEALLNSRPLGPMLPMSDRAIADLNEAFGLD
ncbi:MAG TPA: class II aldolase/adducin family protein [Isosphaeraceae bacterium]|jgi:L-fuculose-phosphate aldolase|nr:class II aldolase/adducin family protein [Isosphaeraceae bacterium]